jgi:hypothetical protein
MSKLTEYIRLVPKGIPNVGNIIKGIINNVELKYGLLSKDQKDEIIRRRIICYGCPYNDINAKESKEYFDLIGTHYSSDRSDRHCSFCGCPINIRTSSLECDCGIEAWNSEHSDKNIDLKWKRYVK